MKTDRKFIRNVLCAGIATAGLASFSAQAYGPLYVFDYETGTPWRWDVTEPVDVWVDGGNFASGTVSIYVSTPETCNAEGGWDCGHYEDLYVEYTNEQGVARVADALASWSAVPTSSFQAAVAGSFAEIGIGGEDGDITGAPEEFFEGEGGEWIERVVAIGMQPVRGGGRVVGDTAGVEARGLQGPGHFTDGRYGLEFPRGDIPHRQVCAEFHHDPPEFMIKAGVALRAGSFRA